MTKVELLFECFFMLPSYVRGKIIMLSVLVALDVSLVSSYLLRSSLGRGFAESGVALSGPFISVWGTYLPTSQVI